MPQSEQNKGCLSETTIKLIAVIAPIIVALIGLTGIYIQYVQRQASPTPTPLPSPTQIATSNQTVTPNVNTSLIPNAAQRLSPPSATPLPATPSTTATLLASDLTKTFWNVDFEIVATKFSGDSFVTDLKVSNKGESAYVAICPKRSIIVLGGIDRSAVTVQFGSKSNMPYQDCVTQHLSANMELNAQLVFEGISGDLQIINNLGIRVEVERGKRTPARLEYRNVNPNFRK